MTDELPTAFRALTGDVLRIRGLSQGATATVAIIDGAHGQFVVKRATRQPFRDWLRHEFEVLRALAGSGLPTPRAYALAWPSDNPDKPIWLLMSYLPGQTLREALRSEHNPIRRQRLLRAFGAVVAAIHRTPAPTALAVLNQPWLSAALDTAAAYLASYPVEGTPELLEQLREERPPPIPPALIHGDCTLDNILIADGVVAGLLDWSGGALGDPRYDLALATAPQPEAFSNPADLDAFYSGYAGPRLAADEQRYFLNLYAFF
jgi:aminoglycoside phosphotransferase (APT) family kinase protein